MWTTIVFAFFVAGVTAEFGWKPSTEYRYEVQSKTLTSFHQISDRHAGVIFKAQVIVHPKTDSDLIIEITQPQYAKVHTSLPQGLETIIPEGQLNYQALPFCTEPVEVKLNKGVVEEIIISKDVPIWEVNIIRSIVSQLQVDTQGQRVIPSKLNSVPKGDENTATYKTMEDTVEGECEVLYDITPLPKYILQGTPQLAPQPQLVGQGQFFDIMKTKNFSHCEHRPGYHFGLTALTDWEPTTNKMGSFLSRSSVSRVIISGSLRSYTIQSSVTTNKVILSPEVYNNQKGEVVSRVNLTLTSVHSASREVQTPKNPQSLKKLVYDYNSPWKSDIEAREKWEKRTSKVDRHRGSLNAIRNRRSVGEGRNQKTLTDRFNEEENFEEWHQEVPTMTEAPESPFLPYFVGYSGHSIQHSKDINVNNVVKKLAGEIGQQLLDQTQIPKENTLARFSILTRVIRTMNVKQLEQATEELYTPEESTTSTFESVNNFNPRRNAWMAYRDAVAQAGTGPALMTIVNFITTKKIKGEEAAQIVGTLAETARFPTTEYMNTFFELIKNPEIESQPEVHTSAIYSFSNLVRMAQVNPRTARNRYPVHAFGYLIPKHETTVSDLYIPYLAQKLEQAVKEGHSPKIQTYIRALGNIAHPKIIEVFEPYLNGKEPMSDFQRTLVVVSLNKLAHVYPKLARSILYKTYANTGEVYQVRVAAVYNLMKTIPSASMLQRMAQFTNEDPSNQVRSAVKSAIASAAVLVGEENSELRKNAEAAVHLLTPQTFGLQYSQQNLTDYIVKGMNLEYLQSVTNIGSEDSLMPQTIFFHLNRNLNGFRRQTFSAGGMVSSIKDLEDLIDEKFKYNSYLESGRESESEMEKGLTIETLTNILNLEVGSTKQLEGNLLVGLTGFKRYITFDNHTIEKIPKLLKELTQKLQKGKTINYQKLYNEYSITIGLPTATGLPLVYTLKTPTLLAVKGKINLHMPSEQQKDSDVFIIPDSMNVSTEMFFEFSTRTQSKISFMTPFDHKRYVAGYDKNTQLEIPLKTKLDLDLKHRHVRVEVMPLQDKKDTKLFHYSTWPYITIDNIVDFMPLAESPEIYRIKTGQLEKYQHELGDKKIGIVLRVEGESDKNYVDLKKFYQRFQRHGFVAALLASINAENIEQTILDIYYDGRSSTAKSVIFTGSYEYSPVGQYEEMEKQHQGDENEATTTVKTPDSETRRHEFLGKVKKGIKSSSSVVVDLGVQVLGQTKSEYLTTIAVATSPVDGQTRILSFLRKNVNNKNFEVCLDAVSRIPKIPVTNFVKILETELKGDIKGKLSFGEECQTGSKVNIMGDLRRSQERREYLEKQPGIEQARREMKSGYKLQPVQERMAKEAGILDDYVFTVKYENIPEHIKNLTYQAYSALRFFGYPYMSENPIGQTNVQEGQMEFGINFTPDLKAINIYIYSPMGDSRFSNILLNKYLTKGITIHPMYSTIERIGNVVFNDKFGARCTIDQAQTRTFDNNTYSVNLDNVWHVMLFSDLKGTYETHIAKEETETSDYMVALVKNNEEKQKVMKVIVKGLQYTVLEVVPKPQGEQLKGGVIINGKEIPVSTQNVFVYKTDDHVTVFQIYGMPTGEVKVVSPLYKFALVYYGESVRVTVNQDYMNNVKGLCGTNNGDNFDFITPQEYILQNPEEFAATWALSSEGLIGEMKKRAQQHSLYKKSVLLTPVISQQDVNRAVSHDTTIEKSNKETLDENAEKWNQLKLTSSSGCVTRRINVVEKDGKHCFSVNPQPTCTSQCHPESTVTKTDKFVCVEKSSTSKHWQQMVARGANPDFSNKGNTLEMKYQLPTKCVSK